MRMGEARMRIIKTLMIVATLLLLFMNVSPSYAQQSSQIEMADKAIKVSPVRLDGVVLFYVHGIQSFPADERAKGIEKRVENIAEDPAVNIESITSVETDVSTNIVADGKHIMSVFDYDASMEGVSRNVLTRAHLQKLRTSIEKYRDERSPERLLKNGLYALLATAVFIFLFRLIFLLFRSFNTLIETRYKAKIQALHIQKLEIIQAERIFAGVTGTLRFIRIVLLFVLLYFYLNLVLSLFPWTRPLASSLFDHALVPLRTIGHGFVKYIPNLIFIIVFVVIMRYILKVMQMFFTAIESETIKFAGFDKEWSRPTYRIVRLLIIAFAAVVVYPHVPGSDSPAFKGITIFLGVLFSLGSSSVISNYIAGYTMTYRRAFRVGDRIKVNDITGDVIEIRLLVTHLRTIKNEEVIVPNSTILNSHIVNYSSLAREKGLILHTEVTIGYDAPWRQVHAMLLAAAERTERLLKNPPPYVLQKSLDDFYVRYELNAYTDAPHMMANIYSELHKNIQDCFNEYGVQIMSPHYVGDPSGAKVVPKADWYKPPAKPTGEGEKRDS
jgi:small-conductance mechanosensitive channel